MDAETDLHVTGFEICEVVTEANSPSVMAVPDLETTGAMATGWELSVEPELLDLAIATSGTMGSDGSPISRKPSPRNAPRRKTAKLTIDDAKTRNSR